MHLLIFFVTVLVLGIHLKEAVTIEVGIQGKLRKLSLTQSRRSNKLVSNAKGIQQLAPVTTLVVECHGARIGGRHSVSKQVKRRARGSECERAK